MIGEVHMLNGLLSLFWNRFTSSLERMMASFDSNNILVHCIWPFCLPLCHIPFSFFLRGRSPASFCLQTSQSFKTLISSIHWTSWLVHYPRHLYVN
jgi:hypothetical protein